MKKSILILFFLGLVFPAVAAELYMVRRDAPVYSSPDMTATHRDMKYFYGDTISGRNYNTLLIETVLEDGTKGYVKKEAVLKADSGFDRLSVEEKMAADLYKISSATVVLNEPRRGSGMLPVHFKTQQILFDAVPVNDKWMSIPIGGGKVGYVETLYLNRVSEDDRLEMFAPELKMARESEIIKADRAPKMAESIQGVKAGPKFVYVILGICVVLLLLSIYRYNTDSLKGKVLGLYVTTLMILSLSEIWYFYSVGAEGFYWFLSFDHPGRSLLLIVPLLAFTWVQLSAGLNALDDTVQLSVSSRRKYLWMAIGVVIGGVLWYIYRKIIGFDGPNYHFGLDIVICQIIGQFPISIRFARKLKKRFLHRKFLFCVCYTLIAGTVISFLLGSVFIFIIFAVFFALAAFGSSSTSSEPRADEEACCRRCRYYINNSYTCERGVEVSRPNTQVCRDFLWK